MGERMTPAALSHLNSKGEARMVNVGPKKPTARMAIARSEIVMKPETFELLKTGGLKKGDAFTVAKIAGVMAAKKTSDLIPLCHPLPLEYIKIRFKDRTGKDGFLIEAEVRTTAKTGVEMEALTAVTMAALTLYDMAKGYDPGITVKDIRLIKKTGGKSDYDQSGNHYSE